MSGESFDEQAYRELCEKYGKPRGGFKQNANMPFAEMICGIAAGVLLLLLVILTFTCYSRTVVFIGGQVVTGETVNIFAFVYNECVSIADQITGIAALNPNDIMGIFSIVQIFAACAVSVAVFIAHCVLLISAVVKLVQNRFSALPRTLCSALCWNMGAYAVFTFLCNVSGGTGENFYYVGDIAGAGMNAGMIIAVVGLAVCGGVFLYGKKEYIKDNGLINDVKRIILNFVLGVAVLATMAFMPLSKVVNCVFTSSLGAVVSSLINNSFSWLGLVYALLNLFIFICTDILFGKAIAVFKAETANIFGIDKPQKTVIKKGKKHDKTRALKNTPIFCLVCSAIGLICTVVLQVPQIGLGWSVNILPHFIAFSALSLVWLVCRFVLLGQRSVSETIPAANSLMQ